MFTIRLTQQELDDITELAQTQLREPGKQALYMLMTALDVGITNPAKTPPPPLLKRQFKNLNLGTDKDQWERIQTAAVAVMRYPRDHARFLLYHMLYGETEPPATAPNAPHEAHLPAQDTPPAQ